MRYLSLLPLLLVTALAFSEDKPQPQLDPTKPIDAVVIIDVLTQRLTLPRDQAQALTIAIKTLADLAQKQAPSPATPSPATPAKP